MSRYTPGIEFDKYVAQYYVNKQINAKQRGIPFNLTFTQVKNMLRAKRCQLTGVELTHTGAGCPDGVLVKQLHTDATIDRLDCAKPYETGNVIAVSCIANKLKSEFENKQGYGIQTLHSLSKSLKKRGF